MEVLILAREQGCMAATPSDLSGGCTWGWEVGGVADQDCEPINIGESPCAMPRQEVQAAIRGPVRTVPSTSGSTMGVGTGRGTPVAGPGPTLLSSCTSASC